MAPRALLDLEVIVLDCQTTGASPAHGHLLEIAWARTSAAVLFSDPASVTIHSRLVALPEGGEIPRTIQRITGIHPGLMTDAVAAAEISRELGGALSDDPPLVIHYARFELPFLSGLATLASLGASAWPSGSLERILCTHEVARRLFADLPRRGLRALAGYFGAEVPELHRAGEHAMATAMVWAHLVKQLGDDRGVVDLDGLLDLLTEGPAARGGKRGYPMDRAVRLALPDAPGIYRMLNRRGQVIYLGKATSLKKRVNSYFQKRKHAAERTLEMLTQAVSLDVTPTGSAVEACLLECDEIKRLAPRYNVALREDQRRVVFASRDLLRTSERPDPEHPIGPLSSSGAVLALGLIATLTRCRLEGLEIDPITLAWAIHRMFHLRDELDPSLQSAALDLLCASFPSLSAALPKVPPSPSTVASSTRTPTPMGMTVGPDAPANDATCNVTDNTLDNARMSSMGLRLLMRGARRWARQRAERLAARRDGAEHTGETDDTNDTDDEGNASDVSNAANAANVIGSSDDLASPLGAETTPAPPEVTEPWTAELLAGALESVTEQAIYTMRRARWLCALTECTLRWSRAKKHRPDRYLVFRAGCCVEAGDVPPGQPLPLSASPSSAASAPSSLSGLSASPPPTLLERQSFFDVAMFDRLRVLTTEVRRLLSEGRKVELTLESDHGVRTLDSAALRLVLARF